MDSFWVGRGDREEVLMFPLVFLWKMGRGKGDGRWTIGSKERESSGFERRWGWRGGVVFGVCRRDDGGGWLA